MKFKRDLVKYVRDKAKSQYKKGSECFICGNTDNLDFSPFLRIDRTTRNLAKHKQYTYRE